MLQQGKINREDMLELTRRMTLSRNCFSRIAGAYFTKKAQEAETTANADWMLSGMHASLSEMEQERTLSLAKSYDEDGYIDGTFNRHFRKLTASEQKFNLEIAKAIPFSRTNDQLLEYRFEAAEEKPGTVWQMLMALLDCGLKNDALLDVLYELVGERYQSSEPFAIYLFYGSYDVPLHGSDREWQGESEEVYSFLVCAVCRVDQDYNPGKPESGFLFPAFRDRSGDCDRIEIFRDGGDFLEKIFAV